MAGVVSEEAGLARSMDGICQSVEALSEWRSSEQVENETPSTSPPYWDIDDDDDRGPKPLELYGKYTWKIEKFSQINKRELRSSAFEIGGYKWYILIYPQGCDVCNHLSLFLCVANHYKLLPGWSHFAQFTIAVVNKDPKKSKYSDTLHRFWRKEHDWGWKKFMELSKVTDGFLDSADTLIIKAQVQVIRERADRPFRCLDCQYRRELVRVYLTNVENTCRRFVEERQGKLGRLIEDKNRWSSFSAFWLGVDENARRHMSKEKTDVILKIVVKHFFIEKEVTSTLVMDSLYSGLKALEDQTNGKKGRVKFLDTEEMPAPIISVENDTFVLVDDVLLLIERAATKPLPPKDEKGPQNRKKDGNSGEGFNKDSIECDERRLTELGRRTVEIFVLAHIFNHKIEVAYQEAVAFKRQEELIREEEEAWLAESEQKAKRAATEKEKKSKRKQSKQKRNNRKGKDKEREEKSGVVVVLERGREETPTSEKNDLVEEELQPAVEKPDILEDASYASDSVDGVADVLRPDSEDRDSIFVNWDTDNSEVHRPTEASISEISGLSSVPNGTAEKRSASTMDDSSSTCSTDSVPSATMNGPYRENSYSNHQNENSPSRGKSGVKVTCDGGWKSEINNQPSWTPADPSTLVNANGRSKAGECNSEPVAHNFLDEKTWPEHHVVKKEEDVGTLQKKSSTKDLVDMDRPLKDKLTAAPSSQSSPPRSPPKNLSSTVQLKSENKITATSDTVQVKKASSNILQQADKAIPLHDAGLPKPEMQNALTPKLSAKSLPRQVPVMSRPSSAPIIPGPKPTAPVVSIVQTTPLLARSVSAAGLLVPEPSPATRSYVTLSYRNAIMGNSASSNSCGFTHDIPSSTVNLSSAHAQPSISVSAPIFLPHSPDRLDPNSVQSAFPFAMVTRDVLQNGLQWMNSSQRDATRSIHCEPSTTLTHCAQNESIRSVRTTLVNGFQNLNLYKPSHSRSREDFSAEFPACTSGRQIPGVVTDEFPHLDIINDLLDDEQSNEMIAGANRVFHSHNSGPHHLNRQFSYPCDVGVSHDLGSLTSNSCRFERTRSYPDGGFQHDYSSSLSHFNTLQEFVPQANALPYSNGHVDGLMRNHWQMADSDLSLVGMRSVDTDGSLYYSPEYSNLACGVNGYTIFQPSHGN